ncbi:MAG: hypothetical protein HYZ51_03740 [Candidatus Doudnabacteria bacterium]|nr:hypothetical protein [Candidatus Doudnabacteria bacterium]
MTALKTKTNKMKENYINIFSKFIGELLQDGKITLKDSVIIMRAFEPVCESVQSRQDLVNFIDQHVGYYWELKILRNQLLSNSYKFD